MKSVMKLSLFYALQPDYLRPMKIPQKRGRFLEDADNEKAPFVAVIDEDFARLFFGDSDPIGRHVNFDGMNTSAEIVGIVGHVKQWRLDENSSSPVHAQCYFAIDQIPDPFVRHSVSQRSLADTYVRQYNRKQLLKTAIQVSLRIPVKKEA